MVKNKKKWQKLSKVVKKWLKMVKEAKLVKTGKNCFKKGMIKHGETCLKKWLKIVKNGGNGQKWSKMVKSGQKLSQMFKYGHNGQ